MTIKELKQIRNSLYNARDTVEILATENYPFTDFEDEEIRDIFYNLNEMAITITNKIDNMKNKEEI